MTKGEREAVERALAWLVKVDSKDEPLRVRAVVARLELEAVLAEVKVRRKKPHGQPKAVA